MTVWNAKQQARFFACGKGSTSDTMGQIDPALLPLFQQSASSLMGYQQQNPLTGFSGSYPQQTAQLTPLEQMGMGNTATLGQPSYLQAMALGNIMNADEYAGAGPTTGQPNSGNDLSLQQLMQFLSPQQAQINAGSGNYSPPPLGPGSGTGPGDYQPPVPGTPNPGYPQPPIGDNPIPGGPVSNPDRPNPFNPGPYHGYPEPMAVEGAYSPTSSTPSINQQSLQDFLGGQNAGDYLHGQGFNFNQGPSAGTTFSKGGQQYQNLGASHEGAGPGGESAFLQGLGVQSGAGGAYSGDVRKTDKAMANVAQSNIRQRAGQLTTADKQRMAAQGVDIFGNKIGGGTSTATPQMPTGSTQTVNRSAASPTPQPALAAEGAPPWTPAPRQQPTPPTGVPQGPQPSLPPRPVPPGMPPAPPGPPQPGNPRPGDPTYVPPPGGRDITFSGGPGPTDIHALQGAVGANGQLQGATPFGQSPGIQAAGQRVQSADIFNDPAIANVLKNFEQVGAEPIRDSAALAGLGHSSALTNSMGQAEQSMLTPLYLDSINREQQRLQNVTGATENELNRRQASDFNVSNTHNQMIQNLLGLQGQQYGQQAGAAQAQLGAGGIQRGVEQQGNEAQYNDFLRQQALAEQAVGMPFGAFAPSALGSRTMTQGK